MPNTDDERAGDDKNMDEDEDDDNEDVTVQIELVEDRGGERSEGDEDVELDGMVMAPLDVGRLQSWCRSVFDTICYTTTALDIQADIKLTLKTSSFPNVYGESFTFEDVSHIVQQNHSIASCAKIIADSMGAFCGKKYQSTCVRYVHSMLYNTSFHSDITGHALY
jgi:hypothetical protein